MRISQPRSPRAFRDRVHETVILFAVGGVTFAIAARAVDEIREISGLKAFTFTGSHQRLARVKYTLERQGRRYFVIDAANQFHMRTGQATRLLVLRQEPAALMVDGIERMHEIHSIHALPEAFSGEERTWYRGLTLIGGKVVPVLNPEAFLSKAEATLLGAALRGMESAKAMAVIA